MTREEIVVKFAFDNLNDIPRSGQGTAFEHGLSVANYLRDVVGIDDPDVYIIALLHDVLEDTPVDKEVLMYVFGVDVAEGIDKLTRKGKRPSDDFEALIYRIDQNLEIYDESYKVRLVKCADRIDNLGSSLELGPETKKYHRVPYWAVETKYSMFPLARMTDQSMYEELVRLTNEIEKKHREKTSEIEEEYLKFKNI